MVDHGGSSFKEFPNFPEFARFGGTAPRNTLGTISAFGLRPHFLHYFIIIVIIIIVILLFSRRVWPQKKKSQKTNAEQLFL